MMHDPDVAGGVQSSMLVQIPTLAQCTFTDLSLTLHGDPDVIGPHGALPASMPALTLYRVNIATGVETTIGTVADASAGVPAYESLHTIDLSFAAQTISPSFRYFVGIDDEAGLNALANGTRVYDLSMLVVPA